MWFKLQRAPATCTGCGLPYQTSGLGRWHGAHNLEHRPYRTGHRPHRYNPNRHHLHQPLSSQSSAAAVRGSGLGLLSTGHLHRRSSPQSNHWSGAIWSGAHIAPAISHRPSPSSSYHTVRVGLRLAIVGRGMLSKLCGLCRF